MDYNRVVYYIEDEDGDPITTSSVAIRDLDESLSWIEGTHLGAGYWAFNVPVGFPRGFKFGVLTGASTFSDDSGLNGGTFAAGQNGFMLAPVVGVG
jgi:hypothetical protein